MGKDWRGNAHEIIVHSATLVNNMLLWFSQGPAALVSYSSYKAEYHYGHKSILIHILKREVFSFSIKIGEERVNSMPFK